MKPKPGPHGSGSVRATPASPGDQARRPRSRSELQHLRDVWQALGREDPLWAVLSLPHKRGGRWDSEEFFATGEREIEGQMAMLEAWRLPARRSLALDFGSGAGRLSRALATRFDHVVGMDVSASMIATARALTQGVDNLQFRENDATRLQGIADRSVDLVYSCMTLQHIPTELAAGYVAEFLRVLAPGGVIAFQFVTGNDATLRGRVFSRLPNRWLNPIRRLLWRRSTVFEMHLLPETRLEALLAAHPDVRLLMAADDRAAGPGWHGRRWYLTREA